MTGRVVVVGGGLSGLLTGVELLRRGIDVTVLEAAEEPGGVAKTVAVDGYLLEPAAGSLLLPHPQLSPILTAAGVELVPASPAARRRWVYRRGRLLEIADSPAALLSPVLSPGAKLRVAAEAWLRRPPPPQDESLLAFARRRFGFEAGSLVATAMAHGVFAGDPARLSARAAFPRIVALEEAAGSIIRGGIAQLRRRPRGTTRPSAHVAPGGMRSVASTLAAFLAGRIRLGWPVHEVRRDGDLWRVAGPEQLEAEAVVVALAPHEAAGLVPEPLSRVLGTAVAAPVAIVGMGGEGASLPLPSGFGFLTGPDEPLHVLGMLFESEYIPNRSPSGHRLVKAIYGGAADPDVLSLSDGELEVMAARELSAALGKPANPSWSRVIRHNPGIPQYGVGHTAWLAELDAALGAYPLLLLTGWGYRGIGVSSLATDAVRVADHLQTRAADRFGEPE